MKTSVKTTALFLPLLFAASAFALPPSQQTPPSDPHSKATKEEPLCAICARLAKANPPVGAKVAGRVYDPNRPCHRELQYTPRAGGKGTQYTTECRCT